MQTAVFLLKLYKFFKSGMDIHHVYKPRLNDVKKDGGKHISILIASESGTFTLRIEGDYFLVDKVTATGYRVTRNRIVID